MSEIELKPYELKCGIQNYSWGGKNDSAYIPKFLGIEAEQNKPYAELWIGAHPKLPSRVLINEVEQKLDDFINTSPVEILGEKAASGFNQKLPFLFKILSANEALSIQAHPNKAQAEILHKKDPVNYPDDNHKPEIAIALDDLTALVGFRSSEEMINMLKDYPEIVEFAEKEFLVSNGDGQEKVKNWLKDLYIRIMEKSLSEEKSLEKTLGRIENKIVAKPEITDERDRLFLDLKKQYGNDVGLMSIFMLNLVQLKKGEGVFLNAGVPHAYLKGNIVECMANSDNVVRAGLTLKFKDVKTLLSILTYENGPIEILGKDNLVGDYVYKTPVSEFEIKKYLIERDTIRIESDNIFSIYIVIEGKIKVKCKDEEIEFPSGKIFLIPAALKEYELIGEEDSLLFKAYIP